MNTRLKRLAKTCNDFDFNERRAVEDFFIGALAWMVTDEVWDECLKTAKNCALAHCARTEHEVKAS